MGLACGTLIVLVDRNGVSPMVSFRLWPPGVINHLVDRTVRRWLVVDVSRAGYDYYVFWVLVLRPTLLLSHPGLFSYACVGVVIYMLALNSVIVSVSSCVPFCFVSVIFNEGAYLTIS